MKQDPMPLRCRLGWHRWSKWTMMHDQIPSTAEAQDPCQEKTCLLCNKEVTRFWYGDESEDDES